MSKPPTAHSAAPLLILIAEDEEPIALALSFIVEDAGYKPLVAIHGKEALELARAHHPALIFTDLMMPKMMGRELIATLRREASRDHHRTPIILMTAGGSASIADIDADALLLKPFEVATVEALLERFLGGEG
ncbi:MAG: response regulator [Ktedonobacterales bacterium]|jgi:two-component system cell cycle response regulator DivK